MPINSKIIPQRYSFTQFNPYIDLRKEGFQMHTDEIVFSSGEVETHFPLLMCVLINGRSEITEWVNKTIAYYETLPQGSFPLAAYDLSQMPWMTPIFVGGLSQILRRLGELGINNTYACNVVGEGPISSMANMVNSFRNRIPLFTPNHKMKILTVNPNDEREREFAMETAVNNLATYAGNLFSEG